ncbi:hypothetical protein LG030_001174, partial [Campylobacter jejuni]|nr:hypothetical protein [Campylobacter jejuni]
MNKKIAIQFYGHIRTYEKCFLSFFENIINPNIEDNYSIDIFIHTWDEFNTITKGVWHNKYNFYPTLSSKKLTSFDIKKIIEIYNPKKIIIDKVLDKHRSLIFEDHHKNATDFSFETVVKMRKEYEKNKSFKYDYILTSRLDIYFFSKFKINTFIDIYKYNSCMRQVPLPEKYILTHIDTTFKVLDIRYPTDAPLFFISNFDIDRLKDLFYKSDTLIIFCDYKKNIDFKILREVDEIYLRDINLTQLPYKLGQVMVTNSKSLLGYIKMPFMLF